MTEKHDVVIVGAGQAGLGLSHELTQAGREHLVLERGRVAESWRGRWHSFCLVLPNWSVRLPGLPYAGPDPDGFMRRDEIVDYIGSYATSFDAPVCEGVEVCSVEACGEGFLLRTSRGPIAAREVVLASGGYREAKLPPTTRQLADAGLEIVMAGDYRNPAALRPGRVLVVGSGQSGCQIAEELREAHRDVWMACGRAPWQPRRAGGRDLFAWIVGTRVVQQTVADLPHPSARMAPHPQMTGRDGGRDLHYRTLQAAGVVLAGHLAGVEDGRVHFAPDLADSVAFGDARYAETRQLLRQHAAQTGTPPPDLPAPEPFLADPPTSARAADFGVAIVAAGYRPAYQDLAAFPHAFDELGFPVQVDGSSTRVPGLHFMGVPFQRKRFSASLWGVEADAQVLAERLARP